MILGALLDVGLPQEELESGLKALNLPGWSLETRREARGAITAPGWWCARRAASPTGTTGSEIAPGAIPPAGDGQGNVPGDPEEAG